MLISPAQLRAHGLSGQAAKTAARYAREAQQESMVAAIEGAAEWAKSKKTILLSGLAVVVLGLAAFWWLSKREKK